MTAPYDGIVTSYLGQGVAASRPAAPNISPNAICFYYATDTGATTLWGNSAWRSFTTSTPSAATFNNGGAGAASGTTFDGSVARTISYNTVGAAASSHAHAQSDLTGLTTADSPQFTAINLGHASDTTFARVSAGVAAIEGSTILTAATGQPLDSDLTALAGLAGVQGDVIYRDGSQWQRLGAGTSGQVLQTQGAAANPVWATPSAGASIGLINALSIGLVSA